MSANRVATVVANEWKDENDKVMPVKQWLEERRILQVSNFPFRSDPRLFRFKICCLIIIPGLDLQAEMQRLKDKLAISERTAKAEAQLKVKSLMLFQNKPNFEALNC